MIIPFSEMVPGNPKWEAIKKAWAESLIRLHLEYEVVEVITDTHLEWRRKDEDPKWVTVRR